MVVLDDENVREYLEATGLLPSLECGMEEMMKACASNLESRKDPINFLASWLMRHNPRHNPAAAARLNDHRVASKQRVARETAAQEEAEQQAAIRQKEIEEEQARAIQARKEAANKQSDKR